MRSYLHLVALLCFARLAHAQTTRATPCDPATPTNAVCVIWTPSATFTDGTANTKATTYRVTRQFGSGTFTTLTSSAVDKFYDKGLADGTWTYVIYANCTPGCSESGPSNSTGRATTTPPTTPTPPVIQVVQVVISVDHAPVYTVLQDGSRSNTVAGFARVGMACTGPVLFKYRGYAWRQPAVWKPWGVAATARVAAPCA